MINNLYTCPSCPEDCGDFDFPAVEFADCVDSHTEEESEISEAFMTVPLDDGNGNITAKGGPADWTSAASWTSAIDQTGTGKVRHLTTVGSKGEAEQESRTISRGRIKYGPKTFSVQLKIDDVTDLNYELIRNLECGVDVVFWYQTIGGYLYGGSNGIKATATADWILEEGTGSFAYGIITLTWQARCNPQRIVSPIAIAA